MLNVFENILKEHFCPAAAISLSSIPIKYLQNGGYIKRKKNSNVQHSARKL